MAPFGHLAIFPKMAASAHTPQGAFPLWQGLTTVYGSLLWSPSPLVCEPFGGRNGVCIARVSGIGKTHRRCPVNASRLLCSAGCQESGFLRQNPVFTLRFLELRHHLCSGSFVLGFVGHFRIWCRRKECFTFSPNMGR